MEPRTTDEIHETQRRGLDLRGWWQSALWNFTFSTQYMICYIFIKNNNNKKKGLHLSIKLYSLPYKSAIIQLVTFVLSVRIAYKLITITYFYLVRDRPAQQSSSRVLSFLKWTWAVKNRFKHETRRLLLKRQGPRVDKTQEPPGAIHSFVSIRSSWVCGPRVNFKARDKATWEGCAKPGSARQGGQSVW